MTTPTRILKVMQEYYTLHGVLPTYKTIMSATGILSTNTISYNIKTLKADGYLALTPELTLKPGELFK